MRDMTEFLHLNELDNYFEEELRRHSNTSNLTQRIYFFSLRYEKLTVLRSDIKFFLRIVEDNEYKIQAQELLETVNKVIVKTIRKLHKYTEERDYLELFIVKDLGFLQCINIAWHKVKKVVKKIRNKF